MELKCEICGKKATRRAHLYKIKEKTEIDLCTKHEIDLFISGEIKFCTYFDIGKGLAPYCEPLTRINR